MKDILSEIIADKRIEVEEAKKRLSLDKLEALALATPASTRSMSASLRNSASGIISEFKRKSPSKGWIHEDARVTEVVPAYAAAGASAISILTDLKYFGGTQDFIRTVRPMIQTPILRKDFIIDGYQLLEARLIGADAVLLIAACLDVEQCHDLARKAHALGLEVLLETHTEAELEYICPEIDMVGVNNRNLGTFHTDVENSFRMAEALREATGSFNPVLVSESGISNPETVKSLREAGFRGFLMGENFMKRENPGKALEEFIAAL